MSQSQTAINAAATRWLGDLLDGNGVTDGHQLAEHITRELLGRGLARVPRPVPLRPTAPVASESARQAALDAAAQAVADAKARRLGSMPAAVAAAQQPVLGHAIAAAADADAGQPQPCPTCGRSVGHQPGCPDDPATPCPWPTCSLPFGHDEDQDRHDDDVVDAVIHEADCPGGDCRCADDPQPDDEAGDAGAFGPDDPPF